MPSQYPGHGHDDDRRRSRRRPEDRYEDEEEPKALPRRPRRAYDEEDLPPRRGRRRQTRRQGLSTGAWVAIGVGAVGIVVMVLVALVVAVKTIAPSVRISREKYEAIDHNESPRCTSTVRMGAGSPASRVATEAPPAARKATRTSAVRTSVTRRRPRRVSRRVPVVRVGATPVGPAVITIVLIVSSLLCDPCRRCS